MKYSALAILLQDLEGSFGGNSYQNPPAGISKIVSPPVPGGFPGYEFPKNDRPNTQFFALEDSTYGKDLPIVVLIGSNYSQHLPLPLGSTKSLPCNVPSALSKVYCARHPWIEDGGTSFRKAREALIGSELFRSELGLDGVDKFHLVLANFCPTITSVSWRALRAKDRAALLSHSGAPAFPHLGVLIEKLKSTSSVAGWVAHGGLIHDLAKILFHHELLTPCFTSWNLFDGRSRRTPHLKKIR